MSFSQNECLLANKTTGLGIQKSERVPLQLAKIVVHGANFCISLDSKTSFK